MKPCENEPVVVKNYPNSFRETELNEILKPAGVEEVVISDACAIRNLEFNGQVVKAADVQTAFMAALSVPLAQVLSTEQYLATV
ncbi:MAG: hypothetical protein ACI9JR_002641 [Gammaproteobacteria bacterium]